MYVIEFPSYSTAYCRLFWGCRLFKGVLKILENVQEKLCYGVLFSKLQVFKLQHPTLPCMLLKFWKISEITCAVEFVFTEAGANRFSTRDPRSFNNVRFVEED